MIVLVFFDAYEELINGKYGYLIKNVSLDAGYMTPAICRAIVQNDQIPYMPYKRPMTKKASLKNTNMSMMKNTTVIYVQMIRS